MKKVNLLAFLLLFSSGLFFAEAQTPPTQATYYRYFTVTLDKLGPAQIASLRSKFSENDAFSVENSCNTGQKILIAVDASYPRRINEIKKEIENIAAKALQGNTIITTEAIAADEKNNFCK